MSKQARLITFIDQARTRLLQLRRRLWREIVDDDPSRAERVDHVLADHPPRPDHTHLNTQLSASADLPLTGVLCLNCQIELSLDDLLDDVMICPTCRGTVDNRLRDRGDRTA